MTLTCLRRETGHIKFTWKRVMKLPGITFHPSITIFTQYWRFGVPHRDHPEHELKFCGSQLHQPSSHRLFLLSFLAPEGILCGDSRVRSRRGGRECFYAQEPDSSGRLRWVRPGPGRWVCRCTALRLGGVNLVAPPGRRSRTDFVDVPVVAADHLEIKAQFNCTLDR